MRALASLLAASFLAGAALAQTPPNAPAAPAPAAAQHIKGVIEELSGPALTVKTADGNAMTVTLTADAKIIANQRSALKEIKANDFLSSTAQAGPDGKLHAQEVRVFPEPMRGIGEGQYAGDAPNRSMTNATVTEVVAVAKGKPGSFKLTFHGSIATAGGGCSGHASGPGKGTCTGTTEILVGPKVPVMLWVLGDASWLEKGKAVSFFAVTGANGKLTTYGVVVEHNGVKPLP
jgi:hypothetical protein